MQDEVGANETRSSGNQDMLHQFTPMTLPIPPPLFAVKSFRSGPSASHNYSANGFAGRSVKTLMTVEQM
jgi:hypothetical protein